MGEIREGRKNPYTGRKSRYIVRCIDNDKGITRFLKLMVILNIILNGLYYATGPGKVVF